MLPNGIMPFPFGPICGSNHDAEMLRRCLAASAAHQRDAASEADRHSGSGFSLARAYVSGLRRGGRSQLPLLPEMAIPSKGVPDDFDGYDDRDPFSFEC